MCQDCRTEIDESFSHWQNLVTFVMPRLPNIVPNGNSLAGLSLWHSPKEEQNSRQAPLRAHCFESLDVANDRDCGHDNPSLSRTKYNLWIFFFWETCKFSLDCKKMWKTRRTKKVWIRAIKEKSATVRVTGDCHRFVSWWQSKILHLQLPSTFQRFSKIFNQVQIFLSFSRKLILAQKHMLSEFFPSHMGTSYCGQLRQTMQSDVGKVVPCAPSVVPLLTYPWARLSDEVRVNLPQDAVHETGRCEPAWEFHELACHLRRMRNGDRQKKYWMSVKWIYGSGMHEMVCDCCVHARFFRILFPFPENKKHEKKSWTMEPLLHKSSFTFVSCAAALNSLCVALFSQRI